MKATAKNTLFWILSVFFLLCALGFFPSIASILFVVVAIALAPIKKIQQFIDSCLSPTSWSSEENKGSYRGR